MALIDKVVVADIIVGIPSHDEVDSLRFVVEQVDEGLSRYFPDKTCLILNVDNSPDATTRQVFRETPTRNGKLCVDTTDLGLGKGGHCRVMFEMADRLNVPVLLTVDADLRSITPEWIRDLATPIFAGRDFVTPLYSRHHLDGTITNNIVYPLVFGLLGLDVRQPIGGEFAFSLPLVRHLLAQGWKDSTYRFGIDNFMSIHALMGGFKVSQVGLGAKIHKPSAPKLNQMFTEVVDTLFGLLSTVTSDRVAADVEVLHPRLDPPQELVVDLDSVRLTSMEFWQRSRDVLARLLPSRFPDIDALFSSGDPYVNAQFWAELVFGLLAAYRDADTPGRASVVEALKPLYFARVLSFARESEKLSEQQAEALIVHQAKVFRAARNRFLQVNTQVAL